MMLPKQRLFELKLPLQVSNEKHWKYQTRIILSLYKKQTNQKVQIAKH